MYTYIYAHGNALRIRVLCAAITLRRSLFASIRTKEKKPLDVNQTKVNNIKKKKIPTYIVSVLGP